LDIENPLTAVPPTVADNVNTGGVGAGAGAGPGVPATGAALPPPPHPDAINVDDATTAMSKRRI